MKYVLTALFCLVASLEAKTLTCRSGRTARDKIEVVLEGYKISEQGFALSGGTLKREYLPPLAQENSKRTVEQAIFTDTVTNFEMVPVFETQPSTIVHSGKEGQSYVLVLYGAVGIPKGILLSKGDGSLKDSALVCE